ncbi:hypothetical protein PMAYCL1PPCAC_00714 [Pristionchus mayeri]|uniref:Uncharacterized protein n=1 Tax=Pristionchus mayeri TaxID=1317129 RepID=A0AAN4YZE4_9BILA|nr:hypothetical protein PMAYCL1PPCAC_00714 [Pristionchus mayeri]
MLYACLATFGCLSVGLAGLALSLADIERFNFGLYLALLSVVGVTVSIAFWIIAPAACSNPRWMQRLTARYGYKFEPIREMWLRHFGKKRRRKRRRSKGAKNASRPSRVLIAFTRVGRDRDTDESRVSGKDVAAAGSIAGRRGTDASRDTLTVPADNITFPEEEEVQEDESSLEEEADFCPLIASSLASVLAPTLASTRSIPKEQRPVIHLPKMTVATKHSKVPHLETVGEQSAEVTVEAPTSTEQPSQFPALALESPDPASPVFEMTDSDFPVPTLESRAIEMPEPDLSPEAMEPVLDSPEPASSPEFPVPVPDAVRFPDQLIEVVVVKSGRKTSDITSPSFSSAVPGGMRRSHSAVDGVQLVPVNFSQHSAAV